jgi:hypothetical protein
MAQSISIGSQASPPPALRLSEHLLRLRPERDEHRVGFGGG